MIGITFTVPAGKSAVGVYQSATGAAAFETDNPYMRAGRLYSPLPAKLIETGTTYEDEAGNRMDGLAVNIADD